MTLLGVLMLIAGCGPGFSLPVRAGMTECVGLPADWCVDVVTAMETARGKEAAGYRIQCSESICTESKGALDADIAWADGSEESQSLAWVSGFGADPLRLLGQPIPTPPVPPICFRVPADECQSNWVTAMENVPPDRIDDVVRVVVECTSSSPCTPTSGDGRVTLTFRDGTSRIESTWGYGHTP